MKNEELITIMGDIDKRFYEELEDEKLVNGIYIINRKKKTVFISASAVLAIMAVICAGIVFKGMFRNVKDNNKLLANNTGNDSVADSSFISDKPIYGSEKVLDMNVDELAVLLDEKLKNATIETRHVSGNGQTSSLPIQRVPEFVGVKKMNRAEVLQYLNIKMDLEELFPQIVEKNKEEVIGVGTLEDGSDYFEKVFCFESKTDFGYRIEIQFNSKNRNEWLPELPGEKSDFYGKEVLIIHYQEKYVYSSEPDGTLLLSSDGIYSAGLELKGMDVNITFYPNKDFDQDLYLKMIGYLVLQDQSISAENINNLPACKIVINEIEQAAVYN